MKKGLFARFFFVYLFILSAFGPLISSIPTVLFGLFFSSPPPAVETVTTAAAAVVGVVEVEVVVAAVAARPLVASVEI